MKNFMKNFKKFIFSILILFITLTVLYFFMVYLYPVLEPKYQWLSMLLFVINLMFFGVFTVFKNIFEWYVIIVTKNDNIFKEESIKVIVTNYIAYLLLTLLVWNYNLYLKEIEFLILGLLFIPYIYTDRKLLFFEIFAVIILFSILATLTNQFEPFISNKFLNEKVLKEPFNKFYFYSFKNLANMAKTNPNIFSYFLIKASLFTKCYLILIRIFNKLLKYIYGSKIDYKQNTFSNYE